MKGISRNWRCPSFLLVLCLSSEKKLCMQNRWLLNLEIFKDIQRRKRETRERVKDITLGISRLDSTSNDSSLSRLVCMCHHHESEKQKLHKKENITFNSLSKEFHSTYSVFNFLYLHGFLKTVVSSQEMKMVSWRREDLSSSVVTSFRSERWDIKRRSNIQWEAGEEERSSSWEVKGDIKERRRRPYAK